MRTSDIYKLLKREKYGFPIAESAFYVSINRMSTKNDVQVFQRSWYHLKL